MLSRFGLYTLVLMTMGVNSFAIPMVYSCKLTDYTEAGAVTGEFLFSPRANRYMSFKTKLSEVRIHLNEAQTLNLSVRSISNPTNYARATGYSFPERLSVVLGGGVDPNYAARVDCVN